MSLKVKVSLFTTLSCFMIIVGTTFLSYLVSRAELEQSMGERLEAIVSTAALSIDGDQHERVRSSADVNGDAFVSIRDHLRAVKSSNELETELYTFRKVDDKLEFVVMTNETPYVGDTYDIRTEMLPTLVQGKSGYTGTYSDGHGSWISAYAPLRDSQGEIVGLLEADHRVETLLNLLQERFVLLVIKAGIFALIAIVLSFMLAGRITKSLGYLTEVTERMSKGDIETPVTVAGRDEVGRLGTALERMRESLVAAARLME